MEDGREMVEEYHLETNVLIRRAWKEKGKLGQDIGWNVEIGDPEPKQNNIDICGIQESSSAVCICEVYSVKLYYTCFIFDIYLMYILYFLNFFTNKI